MCTHALVCHLFCLPRRTATRPSSIQMWWAPIFDPPTRSSSTTSCAETRLCSWGTARAKYRSKSSVYERRWNFLRLCSKQILQPFLRCHLQLEFLYILNIKKRIASIILARLPCREVLTQGGCMISDNFLLVFWCFCLMVQGLHESK